MPWNEPGDPSKNKDPWTGRSKQTPPDLEAFLRDLLKKISTFFKLKVFNTKSTRSRSWIPTQVNRKSIRMALFFCLLTWFALGFFKVNPGESAVITTFGAYHSTEGFGYHWVLKPFQRYTLINFENINKLSTTMTLLTKDGNEIAVDILADYAIVNPHNYLFRNAHPLLTLQATLHNAVNRLLSQYTLNQLLNTPPVSIADNVRQQLNTRLNQQTGLAIKTIELGSIQIPKSLEALFSDTRHAQQDKEQLEKQAHIYALQLEPRAKAAAEKLITDANIYREETVLKAKTDIIRFLALLPAYEASPLLTRQRLYLSSLQTMMAQSTQFVVTNPSPTHFSLTVEKSNAIHANKTNRINGSAVHPQPKKKDTPSLIHQPDNTIPSIYANSGGYE
ncbi:FtsH protease activity modulator HflK [Rickettsiella grylli]|uniref:Protein HflK n=1 Tax=Rickettsiella grylli TaxID=59196 RepID=A8PN69_9COXI|nr:FtsH protease activity modulator HflK [Rickettsiella grylli]EDP45702.1 putative protease subunit HflK [Rickettsiella grylli]